MSERQFKDCDGDTWTEVEPGELKLTERAGGNELFIGDMASIEDVRDLHGPLTEIRPDVDVRALLAGVLEELAVEADALRYSEDDAAGSAGIAMGEIFRCKALKLREGSA